MKYTIITGATSGIGKELAFKYAIKGHNLILMARRDKVLQSIKSELETKYDVLIECFQCDLNNVEELRLVMKEINQKFEINCLINNAGMADFEPVENLSLESITKQLNINVTAPILLTRYLIDNLRRNNASVVNLCSVLSYLPNLKSSIYTTTKHALYGFSNSLRLEYPNLHVLTVHPITVKTNFFKDSHYLEQTKKVLQPENVALKIYRAYQKRKRKLNLPKTIGLLNIGYQFFPNLIDHLNRKFFSNK